MDGWVGGYATIQQQLAQAPEEHFLFTPLASSHLFWVAFVYLPSFHLGWVAFSHYTSLTPSMILV